MDSVVVSIGPFPLAEQHRIHQLEPFPLVVVEGEAEEGDGVHVIHDTK
jgi:hypothetical protein